MELRKLLEQREEKQRELDEINEQIIKCENSNAIVCYETLIKTFAELNELQPFENLEIEIYCEDCETDRDVQIDFSDIITALEYNKEMLERKIKNNEK